MKGVMKKMKPNLGRPVFYFRVQNVGLTEQQFREMIENHVRWECNGIMGDIYSDYDPSKGLFWDTESFEGSIFAGLCFYDKRNIIEGLLFFAQRYLKHLPGYDGEVNHYIVIREIQGTY